MVCELPIIISNGDIQYVSVPIIHCVTCNRYIMLKTVFDNLNGVPICSIIDESTNGKINFTENDFYYGDGNGSKLRQYGYNVNCIDKLTSEQRHRILSMHLKLKNITKGEIYSILNTNINRGQNRKDSKRNWSVAVSKWESDKKFVENLDIENDIKEININKLVLKFRKPN